MNSFLGKILSSLVLFYLLGANDAVAQATLGMSQKYHMLSKARDLYSSGQFSSANAFLTSNWGNVNNLDYSEAEKSELELMLLVSGIISNETYAVKKAKALMASTEQRSVYVKLAYHLGHYYFLLSMFQEAIDLLELTDVVYLDDSESERVQFEKGVGYFSLKRFDNARPFFRNILDRKSTSYRDDVSYYLGFIEFSEKKFEEAAKYFGNLVEHPKYAQAVPFYLAFIANEKGNTAEAIRYGEKYLSRGDGIHVQEMEQLLASIYFNKSDHLKSVALYEKLMSKGVVLNASQRFELGAGYYHLKKFSKAIEQLKPLSVGSDKLSQESNYLLAHSFLQMNDKSNARSAFQLVLSGKLGNEEMRMARFQFSKLSFETGFEDQGLQGLIKFMKEEPTSPFINECKEILVKYYAKTNNFRQAIEMIENSGVSTAVITEISPRIYFGRAIELLNDLQLDDADRFLSFLGRYKLSNFYPSSLFWRAEIAFRKENYLSTIQLINELLKLNIKNLGDFPTENAWYNLGYAYFELEEYAKAAPWFEKIYAKNSSADDEMKKEAMLRTADCAFMEKQVEKAKALYASIQKAGGYGADYAFFQLAVIEGIKSPEGKIKILLSAEKQFPGSDYIPLITAELADTYLSEEQFDLAIPYLKRIPTLVDKEDELVPESILKLGIAYFNLDKQSEALAQFQLLLKEFPASSQAKEALDNAKSLFIETGQIDGYEKFLQSSGLSIGGLQKDSLSFDFVQKQIAEADVKQAIAALDGYIASFPEGLFIAEVLNYKAELLVKEKKWSDAAVTLEKLASKGSSKYQEKALRQAGKIFFFDLKDYRSALKNFQELSVLTNKSEIQLEAMRGEIRCHYYLQSWENGRQVATNILQSEAVTQDDKAFANMILGYAAMQNKEFSEAVKSFTNVLTQNKSNLSAEARHQISAAYFNSNDLNAAEKYALLSIEQSGSYEYWITRSYLLLAEIAFLKNDYFNAKATFKSVVDNCSIPSLREEASSRLIIVEKKEKGEGKNEK